MRLCKVIGKTSLCTPLKACRVVKLTTGVTVGHALRIAAEISGLRFLLTLPIRGRRIITSFAVLVSGDFCFGNGSLHTATVEAIRFQLCLPDSQCLLKYSFYTLQFFIKCPRGTNFYCSVVEWANEIFLLRCCTKRIAADI